MLYLPQFFGDRINMQRWPGISAYMLRCASRPAYAKAYEREVATVIGICEKWVALAESEEPAASKKLFGMF